MNYHIRLFEIVFSASLALSLSGCHDGPTLYTIRGEVTYQGQPVSQGQILFSDTNGVAPTARGTIENGTYTIKLTEGSKQVRITATQETGKMIEGAMDATYPEVVDLIPKQYNSATTLQTTIDPNGTRVVDFRLK